MSRPDRPARRYSAPTPSNAVEQQIANLRSSIAPSYRHRDSVLQRVSDSNERICRKTHTAKVAVALAFVLVAISPMIGAITKVEPPLPQTADRANSDALQLVEQHRLSFDWALVDVFAKFRDDKNAAIYESPQSK